MSRTIDADILTKLQAEELRPFHLLHMDIDGTDYRYTDCDVPLYVPTGELITNGDMEIDDNWTTGGGVSANERSDTYKHNGTYSRKFTVTAQWSGIISDTFTSETDAVYKGYVWIYPVDVTVVSVVVRKGDDSGWAYDIDHTLSLGSWQLVEFEYTEAAGGSSATIRVISDAGQTTGTWYVDEVSIQAFNTYTQRGFQFQPAKYSTGRIVDQVQIEMENLDSIMTSIFVDGTPQDSDVVLMMCIVDDDGTLVSAGADEVVLFDGQIDSWVLDEEKLKITITSALSKWSQKTLSKHPKSCRWKKFKGTECQYAGGESWCDRTYARCIALSNTANYGGFRFLPSLVDKVIWWGRSPDYK